MGEVSQFLARVALDTPARKSGVVEQRAEDAREIRVAT